MDLVTIRLTIARIQIASVLFFHVFLCLGFFRISSENHRYFCKTKVPKCAAGEHFVFSHTNIAKTHRILIKMRKYVQNYENSILSIPRIFDLEIPIPRKNNTGLHRARQVLLDTLGERADLETVVENTLIYHNSLIRTIAPQMALRDSIDG